MIIRVRDNHFDGRAYFFKKAQPYSDPKDSFVGIFPNGDDWDAACRILEIYREKSLGELRKTQNAMVLGESSSAKEFFYKFHRTSDPEGFTIETGNLMGVLRFYDPGNPAQFVQLEILSRFDRGPQQYFLNYLLEKVGEINVVGEVDGTSDAFSERLLAHLFARRLEQAQEIGLFKQYCEYRNNDLNFRGRIDLQRHIRENVPLGGRIAYVHREISFDNAINRLLRHAGAKIEKHWPDILVGNRGAFEMLRQIKINTPSWTSSRLAEDVRHRDCLSPVRQPYFASHYEELRILARLLLQDECLGLFNAAEYPVMGVVFNGADLWEEYVYSVLKDQTDQTGERELAHPNNRKRTGALYLYQDAQICPVYPDLLWRQKGRDSHKYDIVLDAKYKRLQHSAGENQKKQVRFRREDRFQLITYLYITQATIGAFLFPCAQNNEDDSGAEVEEDPEEEVILGELDEPADTKGIFFEHGKTSDTQGRLCGYGGKLFAIPFSIPSESKDIEDFKKEVETEESKLWKRFQTLQTIITRPNTTFANATTETH